MQVVEEEAVTVLTVLLNVRAVVALVAEVMVADI
jgi:hypothetical protein